MKNYTHYSVNVEAETRKNGIVKVVKAGADFCMEEGQKLAAMCAFLHDLNKVKNTLNRAIKADAIIKITFCRFDHNEEYGIYNSREASAYISGFEFSENGGVYLEDKNSDGTNNYWLEAGADLLEAVTCFGDASWAFQNVH